MDGMHLQHRLALLDSLATQARTAARHTAATSTVEWRSLAADRFRAELSAQAASAQACAGLLDDAAEALGAHVRALRAHAATGWVPEPQSVTRWAGW